MPISILEATNNERSYTECQSWKTALLSQPTGHGARALDRPGCSGGRDVRSTGVPGFPRCWKLSSRLRGLRQVGARQDLAAPAIPVRAGHARPGHVLVGARHASPAFWTDSVQNVFVRARFSITYSFPMDGVRPKGHSVTSSAVLESRAPARAGQPQSIGGIFPWSLR
jgi:hypothetical protein